jgi:hypothetical protein
MADLQPELIANRWVALELSFEGAVVRVRVGISVEQPGELLGNAVAVQLRAAADSLAQLSAPAPDVPLLWASTGFATYAWAEFVFDDPRALVPTTIVVTVDGQTGTFEVGDATLSPPQPPPPPVVSKSVWVLRPDDLVNLRVDAVNARLDSSEPEQPKLVRDKPEQDTLLIVRFPPQTLVEEAFYEAESTGKKYPPETRGQPPNPTVSSTLSEPGDVAARLGEETRLVFRVPDGLAIPYSIEGLLDWSGLQLIVAPIADVNSGQAPGPDALTIRAPTETESTVQLPYRLHLSPAHDVGWDHARTPAVHNERAELWHTRLSLVGLDGSLRATDPINTVALRAVWSPDYTSAPLPSPGDLSPFGRLAAMSGYDRDQIVILTSAFRGYAADAFTAFVPQPIAASLLMLSALGGWLRSFGQWDPPYRIEERPRRVADAAVELSQLLHRPLDEPPPPRRPPPHPVERAAPAASGRAGLERELAPAVRAAADARQSLRLPRYQLGQQLDLSQWAHVAAQGRDHYVRIVYDGNLAELGHGASLVKVTERRFETSPADARPVAYLRQYMYIVVREPERNYELAGLADDGRGMPLKSIRLTTLVTPHITYPYASPAAITDRSFWVMVGDPETAQDFRFHARAIDVVGNVIDFTKTLIFVPNSEQDLATVSKAVNDPNDRTRLAAAVPGQKVTFADANPGNDNTAFVTESLSFQNQGADRDSFFKPRMFSARAHVPAVEHLTGTTASTTIRLADPYLKSGFGDPANRSGAFAEIVAEDASGDLQPAGLGVGFSASQAGGLATPNLDIKSLTRSAGPLGSDLHDALANNFDPSQVFKKGLANLFGVFDLAELLPTGDADKVAPTMQVTRDATTVLTSLEWQSDVSKQLGDVVQFTPGGDTRLDVKVLIRKDLTGAGADSSALTGKLNHFSIAFFHVLELGFDSFDFASNSGKKTDVNVALNPAMPVKFTGDLEFVEGLRKLIPPGVFGDGVSIDLLQNPLGVHAGVGIGLPPASVGVFALKNIAFAAGLTIPFLDGKPVVDFAFARRDNPFLLAVVLLGGGGFFHIELDTEGIRMLEASLEFGAVAALDIGVASGEVHIMAGIYLKMEKRAVPEKGGQEMMVSSLTGYLRCGGSLSVLGLVTVSVEFYLCFTYYPLPEGKAKGTATLTVEVEVACFSKSVSLTVERSFGAQGADPTFGEMIDSPQLWGQYAGAFVA